MNTDKWTTWIGFVLAMLYAVQQNIGSITSGQPVNWLSLIVAVLLAGLGYLVNKPTNG